MTWIVFGEMEITDSAVLHGFAREGSFCVSLSRTAVIIIMLLYWPCATYSVAVSLGWCFDSYDKFDVIILV